MAKQKKVCKDLAYYTVSVSFVSLCTCYCRSLSSMLRYC